MKKTITHIATQAGLLGAMFAAHAYVADYEDAGRHPFVALLMIGYACVALIVYSIIEHIIYNNGHN